MAVGAAACTEPSMMAPDTATTTDTYNALLADWTGPFGGIPAFDKMDLDALKPELEAGMARRSEGFSGQVPVEGEARHLQDFGGLSGGHPFDSGQLERGDDPLWSTERPPLPLGPLETGVNTLNDTSAFKLCQGSQDMQLEATGWRL